MLFKRDEPFRFQFNKPLKGTFRIVEVNGKETDSKAGIAFISDLSPNGLRFKSTIELPLEDNHFLIMVQFSLMDRTIEMIGKPKWKKRDGKEWVYGLIGGGDFQVRTEIIDILKDYVKGSHKGNM